MAYVVGTIGPATRSAARLRELGEAGLDVVRLNGSHNSPQWHRETIELVRATLPTVPILLDIPGRKIRTTVLAHEPEFTVGETVVLSTEPGHDGHTRVSVSSTRLHLDVAAGMTILADDGKLRFTVTEVVGRDLHCRAEVAGKLRSRKGINVPNVDLGGELVGDRDREWLAFAREHGVDLVGVSFVESAGHVRLIRAELPAGGPGIVAKVETPRAVRNLEEIIDAADAIMIDRGDLSVETSVEQIGVLQAEILTRAAEFDKPVIVATEILDSMIERPFPTKAEIVDITTAVLGGAAAVMLSGETAIGAHPVAAVATMHRVALVAEAHRGGARAAGTRADVLGARRALRTGE